MFLSTTLEAIINNKEWSQLKYCAMHGFGGDREGRNAIAAKVQFYRYL